MIPLSPLKASQILPKRRNLSSLRSARSLHQSQSATELAQKAVVGHGACSIYLLICYLFFLFSSPLFDQRLFFFFFILPLCAPFPNLFFSTELFLLGLFSCSFFHTMKSNFVSQREGSWEVVIRCALPGSWHRGRSMVDCPTANMHALTPFQEFSVPPNYPLNRKEMLKASAAICKHPWKTWPAGTSLNLGFKIAQTDGTKVCNKMWHFILSSIFVKWILLIIPTASSTECESDSDNLQCIKTNSRGQTEKNK